MVLRHMEMFGEISPAIALGEYGIQRLASRISDLKKRGIRINSRLYSGHNRIGLPVRYAVYSLAED
jgi:hypothetical protein